MEVCTKRTWCGELKMMPHQLLHSYYTMMYDHAMKKAIGPTATTPLAPIELTSTSQAYEKLPPTPRHMPSTKCTKLPKGKPKFFTFSKEHIRASKKNERLQLPDEET